MRASRLLPVIVIMAVVAATLAAGYSASAKKPVGYVGSEECLLCHEDTHASLIQAWMKTAHHHAMTDVSENPKGVAADFGCEDAPFKLEQVAYVLGVGKDYQNFLDKDLKLLPGTWLVDEKKWVEQEAVDGATQCVGCHTTGFDPESKTWTELGVGCESCHGPGADHSESMEASDITNLRKLDAKHQDMICGQCHAVGTDLSGKLAFSTTFRPGNDLDKHFKLTEPEPGAANSQYNEFVNSNHAKHGMKCTSCHDTHGDKAKAAHQLKQPVNTLCMACHSISLGETEAVESMESHAPGSEPTDTCATCHMIDASHDF